MLHDQFQKFYYIFKAGNAFSISSTYILEWIVFQPIKMINLKFYNKFSSNVNSTDWFTLVDFNNILSLQTRAFFYIECIWMWRRIRILRLKWHIKQMGFCCCCCMNKWNSQMENDSTLILHVHKSHFIIIIIINVTLLCYVKSVSEKFFTREHTWNTHTVWHTHIQFICDMV